MDFESVLAQLKFREVMPPSPPGWWPPAIGWWLLAALGLAILIISCWKLIRWHRTTAWRRTALKELQQLRSHYLATPSASQLAAINALLKRCAATTEGNPSILSSTGQAWRERLAHPAGLLQTSDIDLLGDGHYQANPPSLDAAALQRIEHWIKRQERR